jgi:hypothetical protein
MAHCFVADVDAALEKQVFNIPQGQRKPHVHHHHQADYLGRRIEIPKRADGLAWAGHPRPLSQAS